MRRSHAELRTPCRHTGERPIGAYVRVRASDSEGVPPGATGRIVRCSRGGQRRVVRSDVDGCQAIFDLEQLEMLPCKTYRHACQLEGLLDDDSLWHATMVDGVGTMWPRALRDLFVSLLLFSEVGDPLALWLEFCDNMSEDYARRRVDDIGRDPHEVAPACDEGDYNCALGDIEEALREHGHCLTDYNLPAYDRARDRRGRNREQRSEYYDNEGELRERWVQNVGNLNSGQRTTWEALKADLYKEWAADTALAAGQPPPPPCAKLHFIWGRAGSGKTFLNQVLLDYARSGGEDRHKRRVAIALASSGIAALLLEGGRTVHSRLKIPIDLRDEGVRAAVKAQSDLAALLREAVFVLWDEATMMSKEVLEIIRPNDCQTLG